MCLTYLKTLFGPSKSAFIILVFVFYGKYFNKTQGIHSNHSKYFLVIM